VGRSNASPMQSRPLPMQRAHNAVSCLSGTVTT
jgi:hypothetical protein